MTAQAQSTSHRPLFLAACTLAGLIVIGYLLVAYLLLPGLWRIETHRAAYKRIPHVCTTGNGIPGDPLNVGLIGTETDLVRSMLAAGWHPADPTTLRSALRIAESAMFHRSYVDAPVSDLFLFGRKEDLAFEQPAGTDARRRHHVRFWQRLEPNETDRPLWIGAATFDERVGLSATTGQITHHIAAEVDAERDKLMSDLQRAGCIGQVEWVDDFHPARTGKNGGGDPWTTDGRLAVGIILQKQ